MTAKHCEFAGSTNLAEQGLFWASLVGLILAAILAALVATHVFPLTDGWYDSLVYLERHGRRTYADLDFALPPMTVMFYRFLAWVTGDHIALGRLAGVGLSLLNAALAGILVARSMKLATAIAAALLLFIIETTFPVYLARDYHSLVTFFSLLCIHVMFAATSAESRMRTALSAGCGAIVWLLFMTKQNVGLVVGMAFGATLAVRLLTSLLAPAGQRRLGRRYAIDIVAFIAGLGLAIGLTMILDPFAVGLSELIAGLVSVHSKGSVLYIATRALHDPSNASILVSGGTMALFGLAAIASLQVAQRLLPLLSSLPQHLRNAVSPLAYIGSVVVLMSFVIPHRADWATVDGLALFAVSAFLFDAGLWFHELLFDRKASEIQFVRVALFGALVFANSMTASINTVGVGILLIYYMGRSIDWVLEHVNRADKDWQKLSVVMLVVLVAILSGRLEVHKLLAPYSWWGIAESGIQTASAAAPGEALRGLSVSPERSDMLVSVVNIIRSRTSASEPIFVTPNIPILYALSDRQPTTRTFVQWFDFAKDTSLAEDYRRLAGDLPKVIVEMVLPDTIYTGHERLIGRAPIQRYFADYLKCMVEAGGLVETYRAIYSGPAGTTGQVAAGAIGGMSPSEVVALAGSPTLSTRHVTVSGAMVREDGPILSVGEVAQLGTSAKAIVSVVLKGEPAAVADAVEALRQSKESNLSLDEHNAVLRVLERVATESQPARSCRSELLHSIDTRMSKPH
jgi:hypothetical protein